MQLRVVKRLHEDIEPSRVLQRHHAAGGLETDREELVLQRRRQRAPRRGKSEIGQPPDGLETHPRHLVTQVAHQQRPSLFGGQDLAGERQPGAAHLWLGVADEPHHHRRELGLEPQGRVEGEIAQGLRRLGPGRVLSLPFERQEERVTLQAEIDHRYFTSAPGRASPGSSSLRSLPPAPAVRSIPRDSMPLRTRGFRLATTTTLRPVTCSGA